MIVSLAADAGRAPPLTERQPWLADERDQDALQIGFGIQPEVDAELAPAEANATPWWRNVLARLSRMPKRR